MCLQGIMYPCMCALTYLELKMNMLHEVQESLVVDKIRKEGKEEEKGQVSGDGASGAEASLTVEVEASKAISPGPPLTTKKTEYEEDEEIQVIDIGTREPEASFTFEDEDSEAEPETSFTVEVQASEAAGLGPPTNTNETVGPEHETLAEKLRKRRMMK